MWYMSRKKCIAYIFFLWYCCGMKKTDKKKQNDKLVKTSHIMKESDLTELSQIAESESISTSALIRRAIAAYIKNYKKTGKI